jgi:cytochrome c oxidase cbb3-type subunit 2
MPTAGGYDSKKAQQLFSANCSVCHQETGEGLPGAFPALRGNAVVIDADPAMHIHTVLFGLKGATVDGVKYDSEMPDFGGTLNDADIANIINYERSSWGNHGKQITDKEVATIRATGQ